MIINFEWLHDAIAPPDHWSLIPFQYMYQKREDNFQVDNNHNKIQNNEHCSPEKSHETPDIIEPQEFYYEK